MKDTKSHAARKISLDDDTIAILEVQRDRVKHRAEVCELPFNQDGYVFTTTADGSDPLHPDTITSGFGHCRDDTEFDTPPGIDGHHRRRPVCL